MNLVSLHNSVLASVIVALSFAPGLNANAQSSASDPSLSLNIAIADELTDQAAVQIGRNPDRYLERQIALLYKINPDGEITRQDYLDYLEVEASKQRAGLVSKYVYMDISTDGVMQSGELSRAKKFLSANEKASLDVLLNAADLDQDADLSYGELMSHATRTINEKIGAPSRKTANDLFLHDTDSNLRLSVEELRASVESIAEDAPTAEELRERRRTPSRSAAVVCELPKPSENAEVMLVSGYAGSAVSTVTVAGPDQTTSVATMTIEEGDNPLYIFSTVHGNIVWKLDGATERVERFVAKPRSRANGPGVGVVGVNSERVSFIEPNVCPKYFTSEQDGGARIAQSQIAAALGQPVDVTVASNKLFNIVLPSGRRAMATNPNEGPTIIAPDGNEYILKDGELVKQTSEFDARLLSMMKRTYPAGIVRIDPEKVVASGEVTSYEVLPQEAGVLQLIRYGQAEITPDRFVRIIKEIPRFPPGLNGGHSVKFLIAKGVPMPNGKAGHSSVTLEETGECVSGSMCR